MVNKLTNEELKQFDFSNILKYIFQSPNGHIGGNGCVIMYDQNNNKYIFQCNNKIKFTELYKYMSILNKFYEKKYAYGIKTKNNERIIYNFDRNMNKSYVIDGWKVSILPTITIEKI